MNRSTRNRCAALLAVLPLASVAAANGGGLWVDRPNLVLARQEIGAARIGSKAYFVGGFAIGFPLVAWNNVEVFDTLHGEWSFAAPMPVGLDHMGVAAADGKLFVLGGFAADFVPRAALWMYDPALDQWFPRSPMPEARGGCWAAEHNGRIYVFGGEDAAGVPRATTFIYDVQTDQWSQGADMPTARDHLTAVTVGDSIYAIGGRDNLMSSFGVNERYDPVADQWQTLAPLPTARSGLAAAALNGQVFVFGGEIPVLYGATEAYDIATDSWSCQDPMPVPRHGIAAVAFSDHVMIAGGGVVVGMLPTNHVDAFVPESDVMPYGCGVNPAGSLRLLAGSPTLGSTLTLGVDNPLGTQTVGSVPFVALARAADPAFPCGTSFAGFGMAPGAPGELLISLVPPNPLLPILVGAPWAGAGTPALFPISVPNNPAFSGEIVYAQGLLVDPILGRFGLTGAIRMEIGP